MLVSLGAVEAGGQATIMAPTEILAQQHFAALKPLADAARVSLDVLTGRDKGAERAAKLKALADGKIKIIVGTHALFQKDVEFSNLRLAIVDEQHRFGVRQRMDLGAKGEAVDILVMTATPIPRSLELAHYGDMDVSVLDEKPAGRSPIDTVLVSASRLDEVTARLKSAIDEGRQAYWVCPLVAESEVMEATAVGRGSVKSTCLLMYAGHLGETASARLQIMRQTNDGFVIAEEDLRLRGAGDVLGVAQSGLPRFRIADMETQTALMKIAQSDARSLLAQDPDLTGARGKAARNLLYLMDQDKAFQMISVG